MKLKNPIKMMKMTAAALALLVGSATAQVVVTTKPVGYETLTVANGFNYLGLRLHEAPVASGVAGDVEAGGVIQVGVDVAASLQTSSVYLFEVTSGDAAGAVVTIELVDVEAGTVIVSDPIGDDFFPGDTFTIRPTSTLASIFGPQNAAGLDAGNGGPVGADQVWISNGEGGFNKYYFDNFNIRLGSAAWTEVDTGQYVEASFTNIVYTDGIIILGSGTDGNTLTVVGEVKLGNTSYAFGEGFNYISSVTPVGATLATMFGELNEAGLAAGNGGPVGADQVLIPNGSGFDKFYYDAFNFQSFAPTWSNIDTGLPVDATSISLDNASGLVVLNSGAAKQVVAGVPSIYNSL